MRVEVVGVGCLFVCLFGWLVVCFCVIVCFCVRCFIFSFSVGCLFSLLFYFCLFACLLVVLLKCVYRGE